MQGSGGQVRSIDLEGASTLARPAVAALIEEAKRAIIAAFPPSVERESLVSLCDYVLSRDR